MYKRIAIASVSLLVLLLITINTNASANVNEITVKLVNYVKNQSQVNVTVKGTYKDVNDPSIVLQEGSSYSVKVEGSNVTLFRNGAKVKTVSKLSLKPEKYGTTNFIRIQDNNSSFFRAYLGNMQFVAEGSYVRPINTLPMEDYLKGVVPGEALPNWHLNAYKAQAVAARTYAQHQKTGAGSNYNDTISYQIYEGYTWWQNYQKYKDTTRAINETKGQILTHPNKPTTPIVAMFSSSNGGRTEQSTYFSAHPYLKAKDDSFDPKSAWTVSIREQQINTSTLDLANPASWWTSVKEADQTNVNYIKTWLQANGYKDKELKVTKVANLTLASNKTIGGRRTNGGYHIEFFVKNQDGSYVMENGKIKTHVAADSNAPISRIRSLLGVYNFKSLVIDSVVLKDGVYTYYGKGFGHGLGMSQHGAEKRARAGHTYQNILGFYYDNTKIINNLGSSINKTLQGLDRYETSVAIAKYGWADADTVVLGRGDNPVDALTGSVLAKKYNAPLLLVEPNNIDPSVIKLLDQYRPNRIILLGGYGAISNNIKSTLQKRYTNNVIRVEGSTRFETAVAVANNVGTNEQIFITSSLSTSPDALSIASYAAKEQMPILFSERNSLPTAVKNYITSKRIKKITIIGGDGAVSSAVESQLKSLVGSSNVNRIWGIDRYETSTNIVKSLNMDARNIFFARGEVFIDALPGSVLAAKYDAPIILVRRDGVPAQVSSFIDSEINYIPGIHYLGGTGAITDRTRSQLQSQILK